ncbi:unnamed protein product [Plutella xylostella]|uniref:(diamondback moth) hypothetical protein n=1 Tax=Plutella xylostella TaxID=51655 RepID=A0A8S4EZ74_PLUXY|nr:unnamed protein product [Plutella xylostella]
MSSREYYKVTYRSKTTGDHPSYDNHPDALDNDAEFNANQFKLYDDFTTDLRINYNPLRNNLFPAELGRRDFADRRKTADPNDSGVDMENGNPVDVASNDSDLLENEVMVDTWSSMDSSNSPLTDSGASASEDLTPSTSSEPPRPAPDPRDKPKTLPKPTDKRRDLTLQLDTIDDPLPRRPHFLDEDYQPPSRSNIECRIPKPHFLDHSPSPDELDERSDITNPNFLDDDILETDDAKKSGALPKRQQKQEERPRTNYRTALHYGLESAARSSERDKRASQLYRGTWPGEREPWPDAASVRSFSSSGSGDAPRPAANLDNKMECVYSLLSLLTLSPDNNADLSGPLLEMSRSVESCVAMRQAGCIPLLVQLIHSKLPRETRDRAAKALRNIIHTQTDDKAGRREARVWRLLEQVREYCYTLEDVVESRKEGRELIEDDATKHPSQSVAALMKLSFDEEHRHVVCQLGGLQALAALVSGDQSAHGSGTDDHTCLTMRKYAGMTLTNLTFGDGNNKSLLCSFKDFMMALVEQLESPNEDMRQVTAAVLRNLSWRADTNSKQVLREVGAVKGLTKAAMSCQKEATLKSVLSALWNLTAHCSMNKVALCSVDGALGFLVDMLSYNSPTKTLAIVENAGGIMRNVSSHIAVREDYRQILRERNCLSVLLQHLKSPSLTVVSNSCGTLWNLSARCPQDQQFLWDHGAVPMLRSLIHSKHKMIAMGSSAALKNLLNSKPGKTHIISLDSTARNMNLPVLPTLGARKQKALEQELDQNLAETCDNIEPATSPSTSNREEKNLFTATERQIAMNLERHRMTSSSPLMGNLSSQISLSHSAHLAGYLSCSNTLLKGALGTRSASGGSSNNVNRSESKDSVTSTHSDTVFERVMRTGKVPVPTPRNKDLMKTETSEAFKAKDGNFIRYSSQPPIPPPRSTEMRTNYTESGYDVDQDSCDQPIDYSRKYSETKSSEPAEAPPEPKPKSKKSKKDNPDFGDYQETDLDQPTDYSLRYAEHQSETGSDTSDPPVPSINEDTIKHFATEGTPYETPIIFSTATSMSDLRVIGKDGRPKAPNIKENPEVMTHSDEKDTCSIEDPPIDNDRAISTVVSSQPAEEKRGLFDTKFSSGMVSPEKPVNYCDEGTPGCFSRVSSLSSLGEPTEEDSLAKRNAMATINVDPCLMDESINSAKDKDGSKAVTFASDAVETAASSPPCVQDTPLMFSRSSSLGSLPQVDNDNDHRPDNLSDLSRMTSGCISPSELPDSPGHSAPLSPRPPPDRDEPDDDHDDDSHADEQHSVFEERATTFLVEDTPAFFSTATSLSNLTIDDDPKPSRRDKSSSQEDHNTTASSNHTELGAHHDRSQERLPKADIAKGSQTPGADTCTIYFTEDTPAVLSKAGSNSNLSVLSINSTPAGAREIADTSDSSNLSDADGLLEECIQKGIAQVVKNKGPPSDAGSGHHFMARDGPYRSMPPYLRSSTETVKMSHDFAANIRDSRTPSSERRLSQEESPPPPLPPKTSFPPAPPRPPPIDDAHVFEGRRHESRLPIKSQRNSREKPKLPATSNLARNDSLSSLSLDSFGSTDREIFEKTVNAGLCSLHPRTREEKAHSVERPTEHTRHNRQHKSLDRSDKIVQQKQKPKDAEFEKNLASGAYNIKQTGKVKRLEQEFGNLHVSRSPFSYHGDTSNSLAYLMRTRGPRYFQDGPPSLPARIDKERSNSLSSLSNDSFGSTDKEAFERCVRMGMSKGLTKKKDDGKLRVRSDDRLEVRETHRSRQKPASSKNKRVEEFTSTSMTRSPFSYHGDTTTMSLAHHSRMKAHSSRLFDEGPPSLPARIDAPPRQLERSNSLSSLSNCSFGSTDKEVFERCVRMGMAKGQSKRKDDEKLRVRSDDRLESRELRARRRKPDGQSKLALEYKDRSLIEEVKPSVLSKNVQPPSAPRARADGSDGRAPQRSGSDEKLHVNAEYRCASEIDSAFDPSETLNKTNDSEHSVNTTAESNHAESDVLNRSNEMPTVDSGNTTFESTELNEMTRSNEYLAPKSANTTLESEVKDELNRSNESYADVLDGSWSDVGSPPKHYEAGTLTRNKNKLEWTDIKYTEKPADYDDASKHTDTWNDNTCPDDVTFPTISGSVHMVSSIRSEVVDPTNALPDLLEKSEITSMSFSRPDLTNKLDRQSPDHVMPMIEDHYEHDRMLDNIPEPSYMSLADDTEPKFDSILSSAIEKEAARLAAQLKCSQFNGMDTSVTSLNSLDLDNIKPPSNLGSLLSLSASGHFDDTSTQMSKKCSQKSRKKSLPHSLMVKRALSHSFHIGSSEHLDSNPMSLIGDVKPPSEMEHLDMESSMVSVSSIVSEVADAKEKTPVVFDFKQPVQDFPMCSHLTNVFQDLDQVNPPSLFDEMAESTVEIEQTTAHQVYEDCLSTLNVVTDIPSGSENCTPLPSDMSSVESTPKRQRYLTPKEKRLVAKDRYQTYTIADPAAESDVTLAVDTETDEFLTWTKSESDSRSDDYVTANSEAKTKRRISAKQRRMEDRARYQTQTVDITNIITQNGSIDPQIAELRERLAAKKTMKQKRVEDAERFRTRTLSDDVALPAREDAVESTTGYDSLSSAELDQQLLEGPHDDDEVTSTQMLTYTKTFGQYLPVIESPTTIDLCLVNNLKNIEMTASYRRAMQNDLKNNPSSSDFASYEGDSHSEGRVHSDSETETPAVKPKPKITKPDLRRDESLDSNESIDKEQDAPKAIRGRKKAMYVSPYRRTTAPAKRPAPPAKTIQKPAITKPLAKALSAKPPSKTPTPTKATSTNTSPKKIPPKSPSKIAQKPMSIPLAKPLPLERQGTFTKEESSVPARDLPVPERSVQSRLVKAGTPTSPSRLPRARPALTKAASGDAKNPPKKPSPRPSTSGMRPSASNHSLQSNDSGKTVTVSSRGSRQGSTGSVHSVTTAMKDIESKISGLWKKVEQCKKQSPAKPDKRVWIEAEKPDPEPPKLIRSSTFDQPKQQAPAAPKQKTSIGIRVSQIPSLRPKGPTRAAPAAAAAAARKPTPKVFARKQLNGQT